MDVNDALGPLGFEQLSDGDPAGLAGRDITSYVAPAQAFYYIVTGLWAIFGIRSFQKITGPKTDIWLVKTVGVLVGVIGAVIGMAARRGNSGPEIPVLAVGSALGLTAIDVVYVAKRRISPVYLLDALAEVILAAGWVAGRPNIARKLVEKPIDKAPDIL